MHNKEIIPTQKYWVDIESEGGNATLPSIVERPSGGADSRLQPFEGTRPELYDGLEIFHNI